MELAGQTALVTGAGSGIGRAVTLDLAAAGCKVVACGRRREPLENVEKESPDKILVYELDVTDNDAVDSLPKNLPKDWRNISILINNAGHEVGGRRRFDEGTADDWASILTTNVLGSFRVSRAIVPGMIERGLGHIVNMGSTSGIKGDAQRAAYAASKFAIHGFSESLRRDYAGKGIRVTEINPGIVRTDFAEVRWGDPDLAKKFYETFDDFMEPEDIGAAILYALTQPARVNVAQIVLMQSSMH